MIPQGFIQDLLMRVDIVDVIGRSVQLKKAGQNFVGLCPFHGEKTPSFTVSPSKQFFHCFGCGAHGSAVGFLMDQRGLSFVEAIQELAQQVGLQVPASGAPGDEAAVRARGLGELLQRAADYYRGQLKASPAAIEYLRGRGVTGRTAARFALGYAPDAWQTLRAAFERYEDARLVEAGLVIVGDEGKRYDRFRGRVMFPIRSRRGLVIGFGARTLGSGEPKYLNSPETAVFHKGRELYGLFEGQESIRARRRAIVCEGYIDVIQLAQAGFEEAVAALGTAVTAEHVTALFRVTEHVVFAFDGDAAGRKAARRALEAALPVVGESKRASFVLLPEGEDPDSLIRAHGAAAFEDQLDHSMPLSRWFLKVLSDGRRLDSAEDRASMLAEARPMLQSMPAGALRLQLIRELADVTRSRAEEVEGLFGLRPWRRLPGPERTTSQSPPRQLAAVEDLRSRILQNLVAFPELAREFNGQITAECLDNGRAVDKQIVEVWRTATASPGMNSGILLELLAGSEHAEIYRRLAARDLLDEADALAARADLTGAFAKLELARVEKQKEALARAIEGGAGEESLRAYRDLLDRYAQLKRSVSAPDAGPDAGSGAARA